MYRVATNDYLFDKTSGPYLDGDDIVYTGIVVRDLVNDELNLQSTVYTEFLTSNTLLVNPIDYIFVEWKTTNFVNMQKGWI